MTAHGKHRKRRPGVHKRDTSPEVRRWKADHLVPERPPWMPEETWRRLARLRLDLDAGRT